MASFDISSHDNLEYQVPRVEVRSFIKDHVSSNPFYTLTFITRGSDARVTHYLDFHHLTHIRDTIDAFLQTGFVFKDHRVEGTR